MKLYVQNLPKIDPVTKMQNVKCTCLESWKDTVVHYILVAQSVHALRQITTMKAQCAWPRWYNQGRSTTTQRGQRPYEFAFFIFYTYLGFHDKLFKLEMHPENILFKPAQYLRSLWHHICYLTCFHLMKFFGEEKFRWLPSHTVILEYFNIKE